MNAMHRRTLGLSLAALLVAAGVLVGKSPGQEKKPSPAPPSALDQQLLRDLDNDLLEGAGSVDTKAQQPADPAKVDQPDEPAGEDVGQGTGEPLDRLGRRMRSAERLIPQPQRVERTGELHQQILTDMDELIKSMEKKCQQCQNGSGNGKSSAGSGMNRRGSVSQPKPGSSKPGRAASDGPARNSSERLGAARKSQADLDERNDLLKGIWGTMPERAREQMLQAPPQQFLPKYELMLEDYFRQLATEPAER